VDEVNPPGGPPAGKVWIVGGPGCGKSTLAGLLSEPGAPPVRLDALFWGPGWSPVPEDRFLAEIRKGLETQPWVVDGQFPAAVAAYAHTADCVVWVDPPLRVAWPRLLRRTLRRWIRREKLWGGTRETLWTVVGPRSILWYALKVRAEQQQANLDLFARLSGTGVRLIRFRGGDVRNLVGRIAR
jgi:adenylate kinase family enzyme